jgi:hypothetical protein
MARLNFFGSVDVLDVSYDEMAKLSRVIDLDIDIGADAVDYKFRYYYFPFCRLYATTDNFFLSLLSAIANQESLSGLETEMRKLEGIVQEVVDEMVYLKKREQRFTETNGASSPAPYLSYRFSLVSLQNRRINAYKTLVGLLSYRLLAWAYGKYSTFARSSSGNILSTDLFPLVGGMLNYLVCMLFLLEYIVFNPSIVQHRGVPFSSLLRVRRLCHDHPVDQA